MRTNATWKRGLAHLLVLDRRDALIQRSGVYTSRFLSHAAIRRAATSPDQVPAPPGDSHAASSFLGGDEAPWPLGRGLLGCRAARYVDRDVVGSRN